MHADEVDVDADLARRLIATRFPEWSRLEIRHVASGGTDNAIFRLGSDLVIRLPRTPAAALRLEKEHRWLPSVAPHLPLAVPEPIARGEPDHDYPWAWSVYSWIEGVPATRAGISDIDAAAMVLGRFVESLHRIDPSGGPEPGSHNSNRGAALATRDSDTRDAIDRLGELVDHTTVTHAWDQALAAPLWDRPGTWIHGDLWETNLLLDDDGNLVAVIDFGCLGVGDPACDLTVAWNLFDESSRQVFQAAADVDDATWDRGRGWALSFALVALPYYLETNPIIVDNARRMIDAVIEDAT